MGIKNIELIMLAALMIGVEYILVFVAVLLDLISGLKKAKQRGEATLSEALRRTSDKLGRYYLPFNRCDVLPPYKAIQKYYWGEQ